jgi:hypothetical protein
MNGNQVVDVVYIEEMNLLRRVPRILNTNRVVDCLQFRQHCVLSDVRSPVH